MIFDCHVKVFKYESKIVCYSTENYRINKTVIKDENDDDDDDINNDRLRSLEKV